MYAYLNMQKDKRILTYTPTYIYVYIYIYIYAYIYGVHRFNHYTTRTLPQLMLNKNVHVM